MFQIKDHRSIVASMINVTRASQSTLTDFSVGSVARTMMESPAVEIEELYLQMLLGLQDAIPAAVYRAFDFLPLSAMPSAGSVLVAFNPALAEPFAIPQGSTLTASTHGVVFQTTAQFTAEAGATSIVLPVVCLSAGAFSNVSADEISAFSSSVQAPLGVSISHPAFTSGRDAEGEVQQKARFLSFVRSISRGTVQSVRYAASTAVVASVGGEVQEYVSRVGLSESPGLVNVYLKGSAGTASAELVRAAQAVIDGYTDAQASESVSGYRAAGVEVVVSAMASRTVNVSVLVDAMPGVPLGVALSSGISAAIGVVAAGVPPGARLTATAIINAALSVPGVLSCAVVDGASTACGQGEFLVHGEVSVSWVT